MSTAPGPRLYGGWRRARSMGIGSMDGRQTMLFVLALVVPLGGAWATSASALLWLGPPGLVCAAAAVSTRDGVWVVDLVGARVRFAYSQMMGRTSYRAQVWAPYPRRLDLPGPMASTEIVETHDPVHGPVGMVWHQRSGRLSATYLLSPAGALLADRETVTYQVSSWGQLLSSLADDAAIQHAAVTIESQPSSGNELADHVAARRDPDAPEVVAQIMDEVMASAPVSSTRLKARLTLTCDPSQRTTKVSSLADGVAETMRSLGGLALQPSGVDVLRRASATDLAHIVREAFDPASEEVTDGRAWEALSWGETGPVAAEEHLDRYVHDGAVSVTWCLVAAPRQQVSHDILLALCSPGRFRRRVTLLYRTLSRDEAGAVLEREANSAAAREAYRARTGRDPSARDRADSDRAHRAAMEEAHGAGLVEFSLFVTVTVTDESDLADARSEVEEAAGGAKLKMRLCRGGQAAAFQTSLGVAGLYPADL